MNHDQVIQLSETEIGKELSERFKAYIAETETEKKMLEDIWFLWSYLCLSNYNMQSSAVSYTDSLIRSMVKNNDLRKGKP